mgnify:CR=1 FL=1
MEYKGFYLVSEPATLIKGSGAFRHIEVGRSYLSKHFSISFYPLCKVPSTKTSSSAKVKPPKEIKIGRFKRWCIDIGLWHTIKDLKILFENHKSVVSHYKNIKARQADFIYERSSFLNFGGLIISKWLKIPHFYENNGIKFLERKRHFKSWLNWLWEYLEKTAYRKSDYVFFIGLRGNSIHLKTKNWINIENGVEADFLQKFVKHEKQFGTVINICFMGSLMQHHGFELLIQALAKMDTRQFHLHLIGAKFDAIVPKLEPLVETTNHGFLNREELVETLMTMHIGVIPDGNEFVSFMKLFDYGASRCLVVAPKLKNLKYWFTEEEILFFEKGNDVSLAQALTQALRDEDLIPNKGNKLYNKIAEKHTWDQVFQEKAAIISKFLS